MTAKKKMISLWVLGVLVSGMAAFAFARQAATRIQPYYSGDAIYYQQELLIATTDTGFLEIFRLEGAEIKLLVKQKSHDDRFGLPANYEDAKFSLENGRLYVYAVSGYTVYKYDFTGRSGLSLVKKAKNNTWTWYNRVDRFGDRIGLVSSKGIDLINDDLEVVDSHRFSPSETYGVRSNGSRRFILGFDHGRLKMYDRDERRLSADISLNFRGQESNHKAYYDEAGSALYAVDDYYTKKFSLDGKLLASFRHLDYPGFDVESSAGNQYIYFSNGVGVVKLDKNLKLNRYAYTNTLGGVQGWAMGLKLVHTDGGERLVVFNASNILILNDRLEKVASVRAQEEVADAPEEALALRLDHPAFTSGSTATLTGAGYWAGEPLHISLAGSFLKEISADHRGRFWTELTIPQRETGVTDIKVVGQRSGLSYSISLHIVGR